MLLNLEGLLPLLNLLLVVGLVLGGLLAIRGGHGRETSVIQARAIDALNAQVEAQVSQIASLEKKIERMSQALATIQGLLNQRGLHVEINGDYIMLIDEGTQRSSTVRIRVEPEKPAPTMRTFPEGGGREEKTT